MDWGIFAIEAIVACALFTLFWVVMAHVGEPVNYIHNYPEPIVDRAVELGLVKDERDMPRSKAVIIRKSLAALIIALAFAVLLHFANGAHTFWEGAIASYLLWLVVDWYDAFVLDICWFCHSSRWVIPGTEDLADAYHDYLFHIRGSAKGMLLGIPVAIVVGAIVALLG
ncbi:hypothetical protein [Curtanaerobium respiraculi]|uniref:hypothetical protein n=1 Tax=Curtanaerobium respiraculi TaxID=2949669 RepID=UPI0024B39DFD|nr:hypothetical protein [Curtanaerobium respiraculi]